MTAAQKEAWCVALESGDYKQGIGRLCCTAHNETGFCCMGVLCDLRQVPFIVLETDMGTRMDYIRQYNFGTYTEIHYPAGGFDASLEEMVEDWDGSQRVTFKLILGQLNDVYHCDFKDIAAYIRANLSTEEVA